MVFNKIQQKQLNKQLKAHLHNKYYINLKLNSKNTLKDFSVFPKVHRPENDFTNLSKMAF